MFEIAAHQRERIRVLEQENRGLEAIRDQLVRVLAGVIVDMDARAQVAAMSQEEFLYELDCLPIVVRASIWPEVAAAIENGRDHPLAIEGVPLVVEDA